MDFVKYCQNRASPFAAPCGKRIAHPEDEPNYFAWVACRYCAEHRVIKRREDNAWYQRKRRGLLRDERHAQQERIDLLERENMGLRRLLAENRALAGEVEALEVEAERLAEARRARQWEY